MLISIILTDVINWGENTAKIILYLTDADVHRAGDGSKAIRLTRDSREWGSGGSTPITTPAGNM